MLSCPALVVIREQWVGVMADSTSVVVGELAGLGNSEKSGANRGQTKQMSGIRLFASNARKF